MQNNNTAGELLKLKTCKQPGRGHVIVLSIELQAKQQQVYRFGQLHFSILMETNRKDNGNGMNASWLVKYPAVHLWPQRHEGSKYSDSSFLSSCLCAFVAINFTTPVYELK